MHFTFIYMHTAHTAIDKLIIKLIKSKLDGITSMLKQQ